MQNVRYNTWILSNTDVKTLSFFIPVGLFIRIFFYSLMFITHVRVRIAQTIPTGSCCATYGAEDLPPNVVVLSFMSKSVVHQAFFSEKEPKMLGNTTHFKTIFLQMEIISDAIQKHLSTDGNHTGTNKNHLWSVVIATYCSRRASAFGPSTAGITKNMKPTFAKRKATAPTKNRELKVDSEQTRSTLNQKMRTGLFTIKLINN
jgi:hypothetical protein